MRKFLGLTVLLAFWGAAPVWAVKSALINGDSLHYVAANESTITFSFDFASPGDTVINSVIVDMNGNRMADSADFPISEDTIVDGLNDDQDSAANGKYFDPSDLIPIRRYLHLLMGGSSYTLLLELSGPGGPDRAILVDTFAAYSKKDSVLSGILRDAKGDTLKTGYTVLSTGSLDDSGRSDGPSLIEYSEVANGRYALDLPAGENILIYGPASAIGQAVQSKMKFGADTTLIRQLMFAMAQIDTAGTGKGVHRKLDLVYNLKPFRLNITFVDSLGDTLAGDTVLWGRHPMGDLMLPAVYVDSLMGHKEDSVFTGKVTTVNFMGTWAFEAWHGNHRGIDTVNVMPDDSVLNIVVTIGKPAIGVEAIRQPLVAGVAVHPNPTAGLSLVEAGSAKAMPKVSLFTADGRRIENALTRSSLGWQFDGRLLPSGVYFLRIEAAGNTRTEKIVLKR